MLTPAFDLTQNEKFLIVAIQAPYAKASEVEVHFEDNEFMFFSKPYYLRLNLPGKVVFCDEPSIKYDFDKRTFTIQAPKAQVGEVFEGLDLVTLLLAPKKNKAVATPLIEVLEASDDVSEEVEELDWTIEQVPSQDKFGNLTLTGQQCGFANSYTFSVFNLKEETAEIFDITDPQNKSPAARSEERLEAESSRFSEDHYVADLYHDEEIQELLKYTPQWDTLYEELQKANPAITPDDKIHFTSDERERLRKLPSKEYLLDKGQVKATFLGLIDILFAYAYNKRTTEGENTIESAWTINKISATLCWLEVYSTIPQVTTACIRRSLAYPLYRHFELSLTVLEDVRKIILLGRKYIMKCLLEIHELFCLSEPRYILNDLFITDYIVWMQTKTCSSSKLAPLAEVLEKILLTKGDIGLNLVDIESFAKVAWMTQQLSPKENSSIENYAATNKKQSTGSTGIDNSLSSTLGKLTIDSNSKNKNGKAASASTSNESGSEHDSCSSCSSDSSEGSSSDFETGSSTDSDDSTSDTDSDDTGSSDGNSNSYCHITRGASIGDLD